MNQRVNWLCRLLEELSFYHKILVQGGLSQDTIFESSNPFQDDTQIVPILKPSSTSLNTLLPIKTQLKNCDNLIDEIVYQLYGLTPEEKAIIENSLNK